MSSTLLENSRPGHWTSMNSAEGKSFLGKTVFTTYVASQVHISEVFFKLMKKIRLMFPIGPE
jgi:hypothetical protein